MRRRVPGSLLPSRQSVRAWKYSVVLEPFEKRRSNLKFFVFRVQFPVRRKDRTCKIAELEVRWRAVVYSPNAHGEKPVCDLGALLSRSLAIQRGRITNDFQPLDPHVKVSIEDRGHQNLTACVRLVKLPRC